MTKLVFLASQKNYGFAVFDPAEQKFVYRATMARKGDLPTALYVVLLDKRLNLVYKSNLVQVQLVLT